jgi:hypothetical protein
MVMSDAEKRQRVLGVLDAIEAFIDAKLHEHSSGPGHRGRAGIIAAREELHSKLTDFVANADECGGCAARAVRHGGAPSPSNPYAGTVR